MMVSPSVELSMALMTALTSNEVAPTLIRVSPIDPIPSSTVYDSELHCKLTAVIERHQN